jgi:WD40 repeat protein
VIAFGYEGDKIRVCDTSTSTYRELLSGSMGSSARIALAPDARWLAVAREDSENSEGVIDLWDIATGQLIQKFFHPWQVCSIDLSLERLIVALTDGTIQVWQSSIVAT